MQKIIPQLVRILQTELTNSRHAQERLIRFGITDRSVWKEYAIGYLSPEFSFADEAFEGLDLKTLQNALTFPIRDDNGNDAAIISVNEEACHFTDTTHRLLWNHKALSAYEEIILVPDIVQARFS